MSKINCLNVLRLIQITGLGLFPVGSFAQTHEGLNREYTMVNLDSNESFIGGRSLASGNGNRIGISGDNTQIFFPHVHPQGIVNNLPNTELEPERKTNKIPSIQVLRALSSEVDFAKIVQNFLRNVDIQTIEGTGEQILVGMEDGTPIKDDRGQKIVVSPASPIISTKIFTTFGGINGSVPQTAFKLNGGERMGPSSRIGPMKPMIEKYLASAVCKPEEQTVQVPVRFEPHIISHPKCVRVERCGGCCGTDILACEPSEITTVQVLVRKMVYIGGSDFNFLGQQEVPIEKHTKCECRCRIKSSDCSVRHEYRESDCLCVCKNQAQHESCVEDPRKIWDPSQCECACREIKDCNSGFYFDLQTCQCKPSIPVQTPRGKRKIRGRN